MYKTLDSKIAQWAGAEVEAMEKAPTSPSRGRRNYSMRRPPTRQRPYGRSLSN